MLFRSGYPAGWQADGNAMHCLADAQWLDHEDQVLAHSDAQQRELFLAHVARHRAPRIASHWAYLLQPPVSDHSDQNGTLRYRQIEYYRMPLMAYLALDDPRALTRNDFVRLGLVTGASEPGAGGHYRTPKTIWVISNPNTVMTASGPTVVRRPTPVTCVPGIRWW